jgi:CO/xanthine dehydrogenase Mo-binding subunit
MLNQEIHQQPLATDIVRFVGKAVAAVVTQEPCQGEDAIELVSADYTDARRKPCSRQCDQAMFI